MTLVPFKTEPTPKNGLGIWLPSFRAEGKETQEGKTSEGEEGREGGRAFVLRARFLLWIGLTVKNMTWELSWWGSGESEDLLGESSEERKKSWDVHRDGR